MAMKVVLWLSLFCSSFVSSQDLTGASNCTLGCLGRGSSSCQYCPKECGYCDDVGVIDHCHTPGTVHLSIDDGPAPTTEIILDILRDENITASFWIIGNLISVRKDLVLRMKTDGHFIGSHSYTHPHLNSMTPTSIEKELDDTQQAWQSITNNAYGNLTYFRSPYGELNSLVRQTVQNKGYKIILWNADLKDWSSDRKLIRSNVHGFIKTLDPSVTGLILLSHWLNDEMVCGVQAVIKAFKARGYLFVSAEECFFGTNRVAPALVNWNISVNIEDSPCHHPPYSAVDEGCHAHAVCAENTCCHPDGWCSNNTEACGTSCLNGACYACGNPLLLFPAITNLDADADDDYGCPPKPKIPTTFWTATVIVLFTVIIFGICVASLVWYRKRSQKAKEKERLQELERVKNMSLELQFF